MTQAIFQSDSAQFHKGERVWVDLKKFQDARDHDKVWVSEDREGNRGCFCFKDDVRLARSYQPFGKGV